MKTWREDKVGKKIKHPKSSRMQGLSKQTPQFRKNIKKQKQKEQILLQKIQKETNSLGQQFISFQGLDSLSSNSIKKIQDKRQKTVLQLIRTVSDLSVVSRNLKKLENNYRKSKLF